MSVRLTKAASAVTLVSLSLVPVSRALAASSVAPARLEIRARQFPGFAGAVTAILVAANAKQWAEHFRESPAEEKVEEAENAEHGFEEGIVERFISGTAEAEYEAQVFSSHRSAEREVTQWTREERVRDKHGSRPRFSTLAGIAGSVLVSEVFPSHKESTSNVVFSVGRCWFHTSDGLTRISSRAQGNRATIALAQALSKGMRGTCM